MNMNMNKNTNMNLLVHICCAPCAVYPVSILKEENINMKGLFFNPNIHPEEEFLRRKENVQKFAHISGVTVDYLDDFYQDRWEAFTGSEEQRCLMCYSVRMDKAASYAKENGFDAFTTTLLVSPYQKHDLIKQLGEKYAGRYGVDFYYRDFREGFRQGQQQAKEIGLYRQKYCGCIVSFNERNFSKR